MCLFMWDSHLMALTLGGSYIHICQVQCVDHQRRYMTERVRGSNLVMEHVGKRVT